MRKINKSVFLSTSKQFSPQFYALNPAICFLRDRNGPFCMDIIYNNCVCFADCVFPSFISGTVGDPNIGTYVYMYINHIIYKVGVFRIQNICADKGRYRSQCVLYPSYSTHNMCIV